MVQIEEIEDSDPEEMDIAEFDPGPARSAAPPVAPPSLMNPANVPGQSRHAMPTNTTTAAENKERSKHWQCLYPVYFDKSRSREEGRRVNKDLAVENPLAREIAEAANRLGLNVVFEPSKTHPKDWSNPGRVRVLVKEDGKLINRVVNNKHHLYIKVCEYLKANPTTKETPMRLKIPGMPPTKDPVPDPAVPKGWKMGTILPLHSPAVSGGGVSENLFKDMMAEMGGMPGVPGLGAPPAQANVKAKKDKKKIKG